VSDRDVAPVVVLPGEGEVVEALGMTHKVWSEWYAGGLSILEGVIHPGSLIPPHTHAREDECTFVLEGELSFDVGGTVAVIGPGSYALKPRGIPHAFWNAGSEIARAMEIHSPGGFDRYYDELAELLTTPMDDEDRPRAMGEMQARYGLVAHWDRVPEYVARYGVRP
jgi:quercetin dioxygenase-like cupin family protein